MGEVKRDIDRAGGGVGRPADGELLVALAGNPNVGKSTVFNNLTGMSQHTGNWPGKTVSVASGKCSCGDKKITLVDLPGTYSLLPHSAEEEVAGEYLCFGGAHLVVAVCDSTCLERNLNLVLQVMEICPRVVLCLNMQDEARRKGITIDTQKLSDILGVPVVCTSAGKNIGLDNLLKAICESEKSGSQPVKSKKFNTCQCQGCLNLKEFNKSDDGEALPKTDVLQVSSPSAAKVALKYNEAETTLGTSCAERYWLHHDLKQSDEANNKFYKIDYGEKLENSIAAIENLLNDKVKEKVNSRWLALRLLCNEEYALRMAEKYLLDVFQPTAELLSALETERQKYKNPEDDVVEALVGQSEEISSQVVWLRDKAYNRRDRKIDAVLTGKYTGIPIMVLLLAVVFWITIVGANYPSAWLSGFFNWLGDVLNGFLQASGVPSFVVSLLMDGVYLVVTWVISVMLPPMMIFFPLFTLLEDLGYLPRVAFNLDKYLKKCCACGKQALSMCIDHTILHYILHSM